MTDWKMMLKRHTNLMISTHILRRGGCPGRLAGFSHQEPIMMRSVGGKGGGGNWSTLERVLTAAQLYLLNMPPFLGLQQKNFNQDTYKPPTEPHDGGETKGKFSPFSVAASTIYWRRDAQDPNKLQSNSRIIRWSDGSLTLQIASSPKDQYRISTTALR